MELGDRKKLTDEELVLKVQKFRTEFIESPASSDLLERKEISQRYKVGDPWDPEIRRQNEARGKFCLSIPLIKPTIKQQAGNQAQNPRDITVKAENETSELSASILTSAVKHAEEKQLARFTKSRWFESGISTGESNVGMFVDKRKGLGGRIVIRDLNDFEVLWDPTNKTYNPSDPDEGAVACIWEPWVRKDVVEKDYPDDVEDIRSAAGVSAGGMGIGGIAGWALGCVDSIIKTFCGSGRVSARFGRFFDDMQDTNKSFKYKLTHTYWIERKKCVRWIDVKRGPLEGKVLRKDEDIKKARAATKKHSKSFEIEEILCDVMHHTITMGSLLLEERVDEFDGLEGYNIIRFIPNFDNGYKSGEVEHMIGTQDEINWLHSMKLNIIKTLANSGWKIASDKTGAFAKWFSRHGGEDNIVVDQSLGGGKVEKIEPNPFPTGIHISEKDAQENLQAISNTRREDPSNQTEESGRAIIAKQQASQVGSMSLMSNWTNSASMYANTLVEIIQKGRVYTTDEIKAIVGRDKLLSSKIMDKARGMVLQRLQSAGLQIPQPPAITDPEDQAQVAAAQNMQKIVDKIQGIVDSIAEPIADRLLITEIESISTGEYSTTVILSPYSATNRLAQTEQIFALNEALKETGQAPVDRELLIRATDVENKDEIIERVPQTQGAVQ